MIFGGGVVAALREGVAPQYAPCAQKHPNNKAVIVYAAEGILRTGRFVKAGMTGKMLLIEYN